MRHPIGKNIKRGAAVLNKAIKLLFIIVAAVLLAACGKVKEPTANVADVLNKAVQASGIKGGELFDPRENTEAERYGIPPEGVAEGSGYRSQSDDDPSEIIVVKAADFTNLELIETRFKEEAARLEDVWGDAPQGDLARDFLLKSNGFYVIFAVCDNTKGVEKAFDDSF
jgi:hypothetical protein